MRTRIGIYVTAWLLLTIAWLAGIYLPWRKESLRTSVEIAEARAQLATIEQTMKTLPDFLEKNKELEKLRSQLNSALYAKSDILHLLDDIKSDAARHGLTVEEIAPPIEELLKLNTVMEGGDAPLFLNLTVYVTGGYEAFGRFVERLEQEPFFRGINSCEIAAFADPSKPVRYGVGFRALLGGGGEATL